MQGANYCTRCGNRLAADDRFCTACGAPREQLEEPPTAHSEVRTPHTPPPPAEPAQPPPPPDSDPPTLVASGGAAGPPPPQPQQPADGPTGAGPLVGAALIGTALMVGAAVAVALVVGSPGGSAPAAATAASQATATTTVTATAQTATETSTTETAEEETSTTSSAGPSGEAGAALAVVNEHWQDIAEGRYEAAWEKETESVAGGEENWVRGQEEAGIEKVSYDFALASFSGQHATVRIVKLQTVDRRYGCRNWTGTYGVSKENGQWLISEAHLESHPC